MLVLGLETSCDETGVALYDTERGLLAHALFSQVDIHVEYGGVVPELASRDHVRKTLPLVEAVMARAGCTGQDLDGIARQARRRGALLDVEEWSLAGDGQRLAHRAAVDRDERPGRPRRPAVDQTGGKYSIAPAG